MKVMKRDKSGFTLVELMVTLAVSSIALAGMYGVYMLKDIIKTNISVS